MAPQKNKAAAVPMEAQIGQQEADALEAQIRQRAHAIYLERGGQDGFDMDDWLQAEQEIREAQEKEES
jgi:hypothetical protein